MPPSFNCAKGARRTGVKIHAPRWLSPDPIELRTSALFGRSPKVWRIGEPEKAIWPEWRARGAEVFFKTLPNSGLTQEQARLVDKRDRARTSVERGESYRAVHGLKYLCPYCWVIHGQMSPLVYLLSPNNAETYRCNSCQSEFPVNKSARAGADAP